MTCTECKELAGAYALGALDADEKAAFEQHLAAPDLAHEGCLEALARAQRVAAEILLSSAPITPPPSLWSAIDEQIGGTSKRASPMPANDSGPAQERSRGARSAVLPWLVAASLLAALGSALWSRSQILGALDASRGALAVETQKASELSLEAEARRRCERDLEAARTVSARRAEAVAMLGSPSTRLLPLASQPGAPAGLSATAIINLPSRKGMLMVSGLLPQADKDYELWVIKGAEKKAAGILRGDGTTLALIDPAVLEGGADAVAVTLEPAGGGPSPRGPILLVAAMPKT